MKVLEFTSFFTPTGEEYSFDADSRFLISEEGLGMPPIEYITQKGPYQHGETLVSFKLQPRTIQLLLRQDSCGRTKYWEKRAELLNYLRPNFFITNFGNGTLRKKFEDGSMKDIDVVIQQGPIFKARDTTRWDEWGFTESLRFIAHDPLFYNPVLKTLLMNTLEDPYELTQIVFPITFPFILGGLAGYQSSSITYAGTWESFPVIKVHGPMAGFVLTNVTTGKVIEFARVLTDSQYVTISLEPGNKTVVGTLLLSTENWIGSVTPESDLESFSIAPHPVATNGVNEFEISTSGIGFTSYVRIEYYEKFIGI